ncbi:DUF1761 domain-containing protein [Pseudohalocynthiibacter aestuariivivens]|uniref:DUF1761 domain-containing protein n=1 Tax=Roseovarius pelagicus TaxID=2980108 RepID=A0ABY6DBY1_9RHOB|nr:MULTISPECIES: DUF1761 domain-containing protein [Rhodobacterales]QIE45397.1 DUF1761 domain-containing protein [Pseudohalocynthiibacter aestuariivivens]UXX82683.1 DUF1761 domain-containing protein [Roseovarius pelagicus]
MAFLSVIIAAVAGFGFGAFWYSVLAKQWISASGVPVNADGKPANSSDPVPYIAGFVAMLLVAGMMRHIFALSGIDTIGEGLVSGLGIGLFLALPWLMTCYGFAGRSKRLTLIDGGYATFGSAVIGAVLTAF